MAVTTGGATGGAAAGASIGASIGSGVGLASGGTAMVATVPFGIVGGALGGLVMGIGAKASADWAAARHECPACGHRFTTVGTPASESTPDDGAGEDGDPPPDGPDAPTTH